MKTDFQLDDDLDLIEHPTTFDFIDDVSDEQHQQLLLITKKGAWKANPEVGAGLQNYLNDDDIDGMLREVRYQFEKDGMKVREVGYEQELMKLFFDAEYTG